ncbi:hydroxyacylglutathione hydrolase [Candidatus Pelagibacter ubique]|uniref:Hydroxyacylglutathione hydrolase n=1 Tax=Pelagibacter ubique TaxID=198252 RepID=A0ABX1T2W7_PELUQ|nr:hydroxyacylglutathione hydrolase [Candidatus Pelagibacter ubique]NMN67409.1 hydroxyacylglutathione hydrolase [Candidatus Pelagibacter ubique]
MKTKIIPCLKDNYSYLIIDEENNIACVVDPSEAEPIIKYLEGTQIKLKFILNTHHHYDHVGGNQKLKEKYGASVIGYKGDKDRIPGIDILVNDQETWVYKNFEAKIIHIPGHTLGHICFYFHKDESVFSGDTLFSLGCGRLFEGTYKQMFDSLKKLKELPKNTKVFCGHEYTLQNSKFCVFHDTNNKNLKNKINDIKIKLKAGLPTIPTTIKDELECNIFLRSDNIETFSKLRDLKDNF